MNPMTARAAAAVAAILVIATTSGASAQTVRGRVVEEGTARPLAGAFVVLVDETGRRHAGVLADSAGQYLLRAAVPGSYRLVAELIGYASTESESFELGPASMLEHELRVPVQAVTLEGIEVAASSRCRRSPERGPATARLWEEARKALEVTRWSQVNEVLRYALVRHRRTLDPGTLRVIEQQEAPSRAYHSGSPYAAIPAERLERAGYVQRTDDGMYDYFAPDAEVLLSESFLATHCFSVAPPPREEPELVGLAFEPMSERDLPDVQGVLWLDRGSAELRRLDFTYTKLPFGRGIRFDQVGGQVRFERLSTGAWIVRRWHIRMPTLRLARNPGDPRSASRYSIAALTEVGAAVRRIEALDGTLLSASAGGTIYGQVTETSAGRPLAGARVELVGTGRVSTAGDDGAYRFTDLPSGAYSLRFQHPELSAMGFPPEESIVEVVAGRARRVPLGVEASSATARRLCEAGGWEPAGRSDPALLYGTVTDPSTERPVPGAWVRLTVAGADERQLIADSAGVYRACLDPRMGSVRVAAAHPGEQAFLATGVAPVDVSGGGFIRSDLTAPPAPVARPPRRAGRAYSWSNVLIGRVIDREAQALEGVRVTLLDSVGHAVAAAVSDEQGRFRIAHPVRGGREFGIRAEHLGYAATTGVVQFAEAEQVQVEVTLDAKPIELEPIVVTERRRGFLAAAGYYDRVEQGAGLFVEREEIERRRPSRITDLLRGRSMISVKREALREDIRVIGARRMNGADCQPAIWIDGILVRDAGEPEVIAKTTLGLVYADPMLSELVTPEEVEALEVYSGAAGLPSRFGGSNSDCGVVLIWTRRGGAP